MMMQGVLAVGLLGVELFHVVAHMAVLCLGASIQSLTVQRRVQYFSVDLFSSVLCYALTGRFGMWVLGHAMIHALAVVHLLRPFSLFFAQVYAMSEYGIRGTKQPWYFVLGYVAGTCFDICTHALNSYALSLLLLLKEEPICCPP